MGFDHSHYVPILKGKQGELNALAKLKANSPDALHSFTPMLEAPPIPPAWPEGQKEPVPSKTIAEHIDSLSESFAKSLKGMPPVFLDGFYLEIEDYLPDGTYPMDALFTNLRSKKIQFVPAIGLDREEDYGEAVKRAIAKDKAGCCLRLVQSDLESLAELGDQIDSLLSFLKVSKESVDLLVDFAAKVPIKATLPFMIDSLPDIGSWRSFTVASCSFPENLMDQKVNSTREIEREEWAAWLWLRGKKKAAKRLPSFGDYTINHPLLSEIDPRLMMMSPNIRYTSESEYVVVKGKAQPRKKKKPTPEEEAYRASLAPSVQYPKLSAKVKAHAAWKGKDFSWGDGFIEKCFHKECVGNSTDWRAVGVCHHIALVVQQIANLP